ncbi:MAG: hypothetical protein ACE5O2_03560 [Armatimonadota bacterium]
MDWVPPQKPDVLIRPVTTAVMPVDFCGIAFYFLTLEQGERASFASYYDLPEPHVLRTQMAVTGAAQFRGQECLEVERHTYDLAGNLTARSLFYVAVGRDEIRWLLRIRRNPQEPVRIEEPTATFPRRLEPGKRWAHRCVRSVVDVVINDRSWRCLEIESLTPLDPHMNLLYIATDGRQVYNRRYLRTDAPKPFPIPVEGAISHQGMRYVLYYEDFADFALRPPT